MTPQTWQGGLDFAPELSVSLQLEDPKWGGRVGVAELGVEVAGMDVIGAGGVLGATQEVRNQ